MVIEGTRLVILLKQRKKLNQKRIENFANVDSSKMVEILTIVLRVMKVSAQSFFSISRERPLPLCRQLVSYFAYSKTKETLATIGNFIGGDDKTYDHASVSHGVKTINNHIQVNKPIRAIVTDIDLLLT